ncbi:hypothetical protein D3C80_1582650 [compost metagenome]
MGCCWCVYSYTSWFTRGLSGVITNESSRLPGLFRATVRSSVRKRSGARRARYASSTLRGQGSLAKASCAMEYLRASILRKEAGASWSLEMQVSHSNVSLAAGGA